MITKEGKLRAIVPPNRVTWFSFLQLSRVLNSRNGGWNSKKYWKERGLNVLASAREPAGFLETWTLNSLQDSALPPPRKSDFMFDRPLSDARQSARDSHRRIQANENHLNTWLFERGSLDDAQFVGYEIPLASQSEGQLKVDLLAVNQGKCSIIELKQASNKMDSPLMALTEVICYALQVARCKKYMASELTPALRMKNLPEPSSEQIELVIAAPGGYWKEWCGSPDGPSDETKEAMEAVINGVNSGLSPKGPSLQLCRGRGYRILREEDVLP